MTGREYVMTKPEVLDAETASAAFSRVHVEECAASTFARSCCCHPRHLGCAPELKELSRRILTAAAR